LDAFRESNSFIINQGGKQATTSLLRLRHIDPFGPVHFVHLLRIPKVSWAFSIDAGVKEEK
jgi:hypothetical protein